MSDSLLDPSLVLRYLSDVSNRKASGKTPTTSVLAKGVSWSWEGHRHLCLFEQGETEWETVLNRQGGYRLASLDALQPADNILRAGWLWVAGQLSDSDGNTTTYCFPVLSTTIKLKRNRLRHGHYGRTVVPVGDIVASPLLDGSRSVLNYRSLSQTYLNQAPTSATAALVSNALGIELEPNNDLRINPGQRMTGAGLCLVGGVGLYTAQTVSSFNLSDRLDDWSGLDISGTAFSSVYSGSSHPTRQQGGEVWPFPSRPLNRVQASVIRASATEPVITVSGPPGTGKTHTMVEMALAATARGESVLLAASSPHAVDVMAEHFASSPGPRPITFGGHNAPRTDSQISQRLNQSGSATSVESARRKQERTADQSRDQRHSIAALLRAESIASEISTDPAARVSLAAKYPPSIDLDQVDGLLAEASGGGFLARLGKGRRLRKAASMLGLDASSDLMLIQAARDDLEGFRMASRVLAEGGLTLEASFDRLADLEGVSQKATGARLNAIFERAMSNEKQGRQALGTISTAVRSSRYRRRQILATLAESSLTEVAPLWLGLVRDIDDVLPAKPAMFDLVILDEASQIDQAAAAGALLRAKRTVVCGDPAQLRQVSFVSDEAMQSSMKRTVGRLVSTLDVRRNSIFDVASAAGTGFGLNEHYRCVPHLISFSARRFYDNSLNVATTTPLNHDTDRIEVVGVDGERDDQNVNRAQIDTALSQIRQAQKTFTSIGVVSPFRDQVDALTEAVLDAYRPEEIEDMGLSIGTVHSFQGSEHDLIIIMLAVGSSEGSAPWRFVNNPNLFNVMVTRARKRIVVLNSTESPPGLAGQYLVHSNPLASPPKSEAHTRRWPLLVTEALDSAGVANWPNYQVGSHRLDFALSSPDRPVALIVEPHPDGPEAHIERDLFLRLLGWTVRDAFASRWSSRLGELTASLATQGVSYDA